MTEAIIDVLLQPVSVADWVPPDIVPRDSGDPEISVAPPSSRADHHKSNLDNIFKKTVDNKVLKNFLLPLENMQ